MSTNVYLCLIDASRVGNITKSNRSLLEDLLDDAATAIALHIEHNESAVGYVDEEDKDEFINSAVCGKDEPWRIIDIATNWKNDNDACLTKCMEKLQLRSSENNFEPLVNSLRKLCNEDSSYAYTLRDALARMDGIFTFNDNKCIITEYGEAESGCSKYQYPDLVKKVHEHPENWVLMNVPYYD